MSCGFYNRLTYGRINLKSEYIISETRAMRSLHESVNTRGRQVLLNNRVNAITIFTCLLVVSCWGAVEDLSSCIAKLGDNVLRKIKEDYECILNNDEPYASPEPVTPFAFHGGFRNTYVGERLDIPAGGQGGAGGPGGVGGPGGSSVTQEFDGKCRPPFESHGGKCYCFALSPALTFQEAQRSCENDNGNLVVLTDPDIGSFVQQRARDLYAGDLWIGLSDRRRERNFEWVTGEQPTFYDFAQGGRNGGTNQNCVRLRSVDDYKWDDYNCNRKLGYICQKTPTEEEPTPFNPATDNGGQVVGFYYCPPGDQGPNGSPGVPGMPGFGPLPIPVMPFRNPGVPCPEHFFQILVTKAYNKYGDVVQVLQVPGKIAQSFQVKACIFKYCNFGFGQCQQKYAWRRAVTIKSCADPSKPVISVEWVAIPSSCVCSLVPLNLSPLGLENHNLPPP
ncbi:uncharacterized protein [Antedon mediterranea]|uniref:uncharacterized protein n=1 Tax=Antedon mediterranea TaxID=105859 RepID=UPI003AF74793